DRLDAASIHHKGTKGRKAAVRFITFRVFVVGVKREWPEHVRPRRFRDQSGVRVDCQATICHWPPLLTQTSVKRTPKFIALPPELTLMRALPVKMTVSPQSCAFTSEGTTAV